MGIREQLGSLLEAALNEAVDKYIDGSALKEQLHKVVDDLVDKHLTEELKNKLKDVIDKIDGKKDRP